MRVIKKQSASNCMSAGYITWVGLVGISHWYFSCLWSPQLLGGYPKKMNKCSMESTDLCEVTPKLIWQWRAVLLETFLWCISLGESFYFTV